MATTRHIVLLILILAFQQRLSGQINIPDTTFILKDTSGGGYHVVYIESSKKSNYYEWLTNFAFDNFDSLSYQESINAIYEGNPQRRISKVKLNASLPRQWCGLNGYKDRFYLYAPSDWGNNSNLIVTDTTIIKYFMEGPYAYAIDSFKTINVNTFEFFVHSAYETTTKMSIHIIDWDRQIAIFDDHTEGDDRYSLMVGSSKARQFPIIVNYCKGKKQREFRFDKINFTKLLVKKQ
jgi:hypothetical protein